MRLNLGMSLELMCDEHIEKEYLSILEIVYRIENKKPLLKFIKENKMEIYPIIIFNRYNDLRCEILRRNLYFNSLKIPFQLDFFELFEKTQKYLKEQSKKYSEKEMIERFLKRVDKQKSFDNLLKECPKCFSNIEQYKEKTKKMNDTFWEVYNKNFGGC